MATKILGKVAMIPKGIWIASTYNKYEYVYHTTLNATYVALKDGVTSEPSDNGDGVNWSILCKGIGVTTDNNFTNAYKTKLDTALSSTNKNLADGYVGIGSDGNIDNSEFVNIKNDLQSQFLNVLYPPIPLVSAKGDGTTDDTTALKNLFNNTNYNTFVIPNKGNDYIINGEIDITRNNITIVGFGNPVIKLKDNAVSIPITVLNITGHSNINIEGITFDGNRTHNYDFGLPDANGNQPKGQGGTLQCIVSLTSCTDFNIKNNILKNSWGGGIFLNDCSSGSVNENKFIDYRTVGIALRNSTTILGYPMDVIISGNICSGGVVGIHNIFGCEYSKVNNNICTNNKDLNAFPSFAYNGTYPNVYPNSGGFIDSTNPLYVSPAQLGDGAGIEFTGVFADVNAIPNKYSEIYGNICKNNQVGIRLEEETQFVSVCDNQCNFNDTYGVFVFSSLFNKINNNFCIGNLMDGIRIEQSSGKLLPNHNTINGNHSNKNGRFGICLVASQGNVISSNNLSDNNTVTSNTAGGMGLFHLNTVYCNNNIINSNEFISYESNDKYGIYSDDSNNANNIVSSNIFEGLTVSPLNLNKANNTINGNFGYKTSAYGQTKITAGQTSVVTPHGLPFAPNNGNIFVCPVTSPLGKYWYVSSADETNFTITIDSVAASDIFFNWNIAEDM